eukprot:comp13577_c0_seq2/m.9166 comp13577_c0_seq2/g.9166  ORF comp13577_c0_seq2/g.9166 comp13577_c0_seq2/m.9166 type:complete len:301 (-) comp13577_c0_seq2:195-1097(-)
MLASACPGWVCYAEKTHGDYVLPYISSTKSPQQVMGNIVKDYLSRCLGKSRNDEVYHIAVMPCYDKKLEASRQDFYNDIYSTRDVDCVITTGEVERMFEEKNVDFKGLAGYPLDTVASLANKTSVPPEFEFYGHAGGGSGGYLECTFRHAAKELFGVEVGPIEYKVGKNKDFREVTLEVNGEVVLRFAAAYGFRNIQNLVQKIKRGKSPYDFVEVMACPSGCLNGGGQIKAASPDQSKDLLAHVTKLYQSVPEVHPESDPTVQMLYSDWLGGPGSDLARKTLHTSYHGVEKTVTGLTAKW